MSVVCPWCGEEVILSGDICPLCRHEVLPEHLSGMEAMDGELEGVVQEEYDRESMASEAWDAELYACPKCGHRECRVNEVAMTGAGLSKLLDIQHHHYLFVSCLRCGSVEILDPNVLEARKKGGFSSGLDLFL